MLRILRIYRVLFCLSLSLGLLPSPGLADPSIAESRCTNNNLIHEAPYFLPPPIKKFRHFKNIYLSAFFNPFHVIHDVIAKEGEPLFFQGKFDYDWILHKDLEDEFIHVYLYGSSFTNWQYLGRYKTNQNGEVLVPFMGVGPGDYLVRMVVEGDGSTVDGAINVVQPSHQAVLFDIDGTLTTSDFEMVKDYLSLATAEPYYYAAEMLEAYREKGYQLIFLTARPYWMASVSHDWLASTLNQSGWPLKTRKSLREDTTQHKANYLRQLIQDKKLDIVRAYGNATTDIEAYALAGIPKKDTYIIGPNAGQEETQPIQGHYYNHYQEVVTGTAMASCKTN